MQPIAIGCLRLTPSPQFSRLYGGTLRLMAATHGYFLMSVIEFDHSGDAQTHNALMADYIRAAKAEAVLAAGLEHLAGGEHAITELCVLVTPEQTYPRGHHWPSHVPNAGSVR